ncbi:helix-turn-helix transcriptional regulator [Streptomyces sp. NPDC007172]|uniref:helix-turn-helix transcriptional regulator n=1 Tax=Streptomyces sp. NPDC007172 TaxID=3364776 RepID=UPI00367EED68
MGRGSADFSGEALRELRQTRRVEGRLLSAAALAKALRTSKSRILAYENGTSRPDPQRVADIADLFGVPPKALRPHATGTSIRRLRCDAGLTIAEAARRLSISRSGYTNIEHSALLPARDDGSVRNALPDVFGTSPRVVDRALRTHPAARRRQDELADHLGEIFGRAHTTHTPAVVDADDPHLLAIAPLLQRSLAVSCRLVNAELDSYRGLLHEQAVLRADMAFAQSARAAARARTRAESLDAQLPDAHRRSAQHLTRFLSEAMNVRQWRLMVALHDTQEGMPLSGTERYAHVNDVQALVLRRFVQKHLPQRADQPHVSITERGAHAVRNGFQRYGHLYPRVQAPALSYYWTRLQTAPAGSAEPSGLPRTARYRRSVSRPARGTDGQAGAPSHVPGGTGGRLAGRDKW